MTKENRLDWCFKSTIQSSRDSIRSLLGSGRYTLDELLGEVTNNQLWSLVKIFRDTEYWCDFLTALLRLSPEIWDRHDLYPEDARHAFTPKEKNDIISLFSQMVTNGKHSPLLLFI